MENGKTSCREILRHPFLRSTTMINPSQSPYQLVRSGSNSSGGGGSGSPGSSPSSALRRKSLGSPTHLLPGLGLGLRKSGSDSSFASQGVSDSTPRAGNVDAGDFLSDDDDILDDYDDDIGLETFKGIGAHEPVAKKTLTLQQQKLLRAAGGGK